MAILFTSPRKKQRVIFWTVAMSLLVLLFAISLVAFPPVFPWFSMFFEPSPEVSEPGGVTINTSLLDSPQIKILDVFEQIQSKFDYVLEDKNGKKITGTISALSADSVRIFFEGEGFKVISVKQSMVGRTDPFTSY